VSLATAVEIFPPHWATPEFGFKSMKKAMSTAAIATGILCLSVARRMIFPAKPHPKYSLPLGNFMLSAQSTQQLKLGCFQPGADCAVPYDTLGAIFHALIIANAAKRDNCPKRGFR
jgi:hypothetical protein